jgi:putative ABC transport system permease protein
MINYLPFSGPGSATDFEIVGRPKPAPGDEPGTRVFVTDEDFFGTLNIRLKRGRLYTRLETTEPKRVVVINEALAKKYFPNEDPIGKKLLISMREPNEPTEIIGIVGNTKYETLQEEAEPAVYWPQSELVYPFMTVVIGTKTDPLKLAQAATAIVRELDPEQPVADIRTMDEWVGDSTARPRFNMMLLGILAVVALILALAGIYAVMSHAVVQRTQEMGIRMALGASPKAITSLLMKEAFKLVVAGAAGGIVLALIVSRLLTTLLYETSNDDPKIIAAVLFLLVLNALIACYIPSRRASKTDPLIALRYE